MQPGTVRLLVELVEIRVSPQGAPSSLVVTRSSPLSDAGSLTVNVTVALAEQLKDEGSTLRLPFSSVPWGWGPLTATKPTTAMSATMTRPPMSTRITGRLLPLAGATGA